MKSRKGGWAAHVARMGKRGQRIGRSLVVKPEGKRPLGRSRIMFVVNIKMHHGGMDRDVEWIGLAQNKGLCGELL
jgi:hypothetical protein